MIRNLLLPPAAPFKTGLGAVSPALLACSLLAACAKPFIATFHREQEIDIAHCDEADRSRLKRYLENRKWLEREDFWFLKDREKPGLRIRHRFGDSLLKVGLELPIDVDRYGWVGPAIESMVQDIEAHAFDCDLRVYSKSLSSRDTARTDPLTTRAWDSLAPDTLRGIWFREIETPRPSPHISQVYRGRKGWYYPDVHDFGNRYRQNQDYAMAFFFRTLPVVHPVFHSLLIKEQEGRYQAIFSSYKDAQFIWKAGYVLDSARFSALVREVDFIAKANTYILGRPDYVDPLVQSECMRELGMEKARTDSAVRNIEARCRPLSHEGVILDKSRPTPVYLYGSRSLARDHDRRILEDLRHKMIVNLMRALPAREIVWNRD